MAVGGGFMKKKVRYLFCVIFIFCMFLVAQVLDDKEVIFPEILALALGAWVSEKQPWKVDRVRMFVLMSISSLVGILVVRYVNLPLIFRIAIGFCFAGFMLTLFRCTIVPMISACILPMFIGTTSFIYPISVTTMSFVIVVVQFLIERFGLKPETVVESVEMDVKEEFFKWFKMLILLMAICVIPTFTKQLYFVVPPLIVAFVEFSNIKSKVRDNFKKIWIAIVCAGVIGAGCRIILNAQLGMPLWFCGVCATVLLFVVFEILKVGFPPACAIVLLPTILPVDNLYLYPFEVAIGSAVLITVAMKAFREVEVVEEISEV